MQTFCGLDLSEPPDADDSVRTRLARKRSIYQSILVNADYQTPGGWEVTIPAGLPALRALWENIPDIQEQFPANVVGERAPNAATYFRLRAVGRNGYYRASPRDAVNFWMSVRRVERQLEHGIGGAGTNKFLNDIDLGLLNVLAGRSKNDTFIRGSNTIGNVARQFHSPAGSSDVGRDIYEFLRQAMKPGSNGTKQLAASGCSDIADYRRLMHANHRFVDPMEMARIQCSRTLGGPAHGMPGPLVVGISKTGKVVEHASIIDHMLQLQEDGQTKRTGTWLLPVVAGDFLPCLNVMPSLPSRMTTLPVRRMRSTSVS